MCFISHLLVLLVLILHSTAYHNLYYDKTYRIILRCSEKSEYNTVNDISHESSNSSSWLTSLMDSKIKRDIMSSTRYVNYYIGRKVIKQLKNIIDDSKQISYSTVNLDGININRNQTDAYIKLLKLGINPLENSKLLGNFNDKIQTNDKSSMYVSLNTIIGKAKYDGQRIKKKINFPFDHSRETCDNSADPINIEEFYEKNESNTTAKNVIIQNNCEAVIESEGSVETPIKNLLDNVEMLKLLKIQFDDIVSLCNEIIIGEKIDVTNSNYIYIQVFMDDIMDGILAIDKVLLIAKKKNVFDISTSQIINSNEEYVPGIKRPDILDIYCAVESILVNYKSHSRDNPTEHSKILSLIKFDHIVDRDGMLMSCYIPLCKILAEMLNIDVSGVIGMIKNTSNLVKNETIIVNGVNSVITSENVKSEELLGAISKVSRESLDIAAGLSIMSIKTVTNILTGFSKQAVKRMKSNFYLNDPSISIMIPGKNSTNRFRTERWNLVGTLDSDEYEKNADLYDD